MFIKTISPIRRHPGFVEIAWRPEISKKPLIRLSMLNDLSAAQTLKVIKAIYRARKISKEWLKKYGKVKSR
jgi:hypothetical protein